MIFCSRQNREPHDKLWPMEGKNKMHRRCFHHDYRSRRIYMLTMTVEERRPLLGSLKVSEGVAAVELSPLGLEVERSLLGLPGYYPELQVMAQQVMPDHVHVIVFVERELPRHLGQVVAGFKYGTTRAMRELQPAAKPRPTQPTLPATPPAALPATQPGTQPAAKPRPTQPTTQPTNLPATQAEVEGSGVVCGSVWPCQSQRLWSEGYHDMIVWREGQLQKMIDYVHDNPRRLAMKRAQPDLFRVRRQLVVAGREMDALGNLFLLEWPQIVQVRCSRSLTQAAVEQEVARMLKLCEQGAVLVTPSISPGEKAVTRAAFEAGHRVILLLENGFGEFAKPGGRLFDACAEGRLLLLAPWEHHNDKRAIKRWQCEELNAMAYTIATLHV